MFVMSPMTDIKEKSPISFPTEKEVVEACSSNKGHDELTVEIRNFDCK